MGGCRCTFRDCSTNSTNSPGLHFFHYPIKDWERCTIWAKNANTMNYLKLEMRKLRNKVVCEKHFRDECFMNYKKDRLVQKAIPTLLRFDDGSVLDYEEGENPTPKFLSPTKLQHLLPPGSSSSAGTAEKILEFCFAENKVEDLPPEPRRLKLPPPRILNVQAPQNVLMRNINPEIPKKEVKEESEAFILQAVVDIDDSDIEMENVVLAGENSYSDTAKTDESVKSMFAEKELELTNEIASLKVEAVAKNDQLLSMQAEIECLKAQVVETKTQAQITQVKTISTSMKAESPSTSTAPLTKAQLFNGIKKYLSPSMASMVRMEMFGGPEREWKKDEKNVAVELLTLGGHVFDFIRDEWRCRLPPKKDVEQWISQLNEFQDEEDL